MTAAAATTTRPTSATLYFGPWYRKSPFFEKTLDAGCSAYDIDNHMYLPGYYADPIEEYWALLNGVTVWDVSVERIVEITGKDASAFTNSLTCRDLQVRCQVKALHGFSAHADDPELRAWLGNFIKCRRPGDPGVPKQVFLVHGDPPAQDAIKPKIEAMGFAVRIPSWHETVILD